MDATALRNHSFGQLDDTLEPSGAPSGVDEAEVIFSTELDSNSTPEKRRPISRSLKQDVPRSEQPRPGLRRQTTVPEPHQPPPQAPPQSIPRTDSDDSLSLYQIKSLVRELPRVEHTPYAFVYKDTSILPDELEEWLSYNLEDCTMLFRSRASFAAVWSKFNTGSEASYLAGGMDWIPSQRKEAFMIEVLENLDAADLDERVTRLDALVYIVLGCWHETAGVQRFEEDVLSGGDFEDDVKADPLEEWKSSNRDCVVQFQQIEANVALFVKTRAIGAIFKNLRQVCSREYTLQTAREEKAQDSRHLERSELCNTLTIAYFLLETIRATDSVETRTSGREQILNLRPSLLAYLSEVVDKIRWDDAIELPQGRILLLYWKSILLAIGGTEDLKQVKSSFDDEEEETSDSKGLPIITASPLDYHLFRQEISSKYPAYNPPPPLFPLEPENTSMMPPLKPALQRMAETAPPFIGVQGHFTSIFDQPVHIATPAPSPPPSPATGKGGKKQNYQTNQLFPFLYPPLDETSNQLGGMGSTILQDALVGRRWEGPDIPASILEAAELFAKRMRASRAMKQLWEERVEFMKYERGWKASSDDDDVISVVNLDEIVEPKPHTGDVEDRLDVVEDFYRDALPHLQSVVTVLVKNILNHVTNLVTQSTNQNGLQSGFPFQEGQNGDHPNKADGPSQTNGTQPTGPPVTRDERDLSRTQEITAKAVCGVTILLLKWFKVSHILKYEYLTQLLVDANYIPIILKLMQTQDIERLVNFRCDHKESGLFYSCRANSRTGIPNPPPIKPDDDLSYIRASSSEDEAAPPPIKRHRSPPPIHPPPPPTTAPPDPPTAQNQIASDANAQTPSSSTLPEVDELGILTTALPTKPITDFSQRNFFSAITSLRILHAVCTRHAHRNLMLVQYKSTPVFRRMLRVPQPELRKYALKLVKAQVPFCGRKWRQANMRTITAVWLTIRPELRDEWLSGGDVDAVVEESLPREQAIRGLVHWWHLRKYWDAVRPPGTPGFGPDGIDDGGGGYETEFDVGEEGHGSETGSVGGRKRTSSAAKSREERRRWLDEENDFFRRELERMEWNWGSEADALDVEERGAPDHAPVWDGVQQTEAPWGGAAL